jgi:hypothetical protein
VYELGLKFSHALSVDEADGLVRWAEEHDCNLGAGDSEFVLSADSIVKIAGAVRDLARSGLGADIQSPEFVAAAT